MKWPFRRHRESQSEAPTPTYRMHVTAPDATSEEIERVLTAAFTRRHPPEPLTARQVISAVLAEVPALDGQHDYIAGLAGDILLGLDANRLEIVASGEIE